MNLEYGLIKAPFEALSHTTRNAQKIVAKDIATIVTQVKTLKAIKPSVDEKDNILKSAQKLKGSLQGLKRKLEESQKASNKHMHRCKTRLQHLEKLEDARLHAEQGESPLKRRSLGTSQNSSRPTEQNSLNALLESKTPDISNAEQEKDANLLHAAEKQHLEIVKTKRDRFFVDHLLREGHYSTAIELAAEADIKDLVDLDAFLGAKKVIEGLQQRSCTKALAWCGEHRSQLNRAKSSLEFRLRLQEFIELVRSKQLGPAVEYAQKQLSPLAGEHIQDLQDAMTTLAFVNLPNFLELVDSPAFQELTATNAAAATLSSLSNTPPLSNESSSASSNSRMPLNSGSQPSLSQAILSSLGGLPLSPPRQAQPLTPVQGQNPQSPSNNSQSSLSQASITSVRVRSPPPPPRSTLFAGLTTAAMDTSTDSKSDSKAAKEARNGSSHANGSTSPGVQGTVANGNANGYSLLKYQKFFSKVRWTELVEEFRSEFLSLNGLTRHSLLDITLQSGLSALKTPYCSSAGSGNHNPDCPVCCRPMTQLAAKLPLPSRLHSRIVCRISGLIMDDNNPPLALPNGMVYSKNALTDMAAKADGMVKCPRTNEEFHLSDCRVVYVL